MRSSLLLPALAAFALVPAAANAATITSDGNGTYTYTGAPGEDNDLSLQVPAGGGLLFYANAGVAVTSAPAGCHAAYDDGDWSKVTCTDPKAIVINAGDGDEWITTDSSEIKVPTTVDGGPGADRLDGDDGPETLIGGSGADRLDGRKGDDVLDGGDGDDELTGYAGSDNLSGGPGNDLLHPDYHEEPSADIVDGGAGIDTIDSDYSSRFRDSTLPVGLSFTFAGGADDGRPGENDDIRNVERLFLAESPRFVGSEGNDFVKVAQATNAGELIGNGGDDDLSGADGMEKIDGGTGNDRLVGGFNDDVITGGPGRDQIIGDLPTGDCGPIWCKYPFGNDTINAQDGEVDTISCGWGTDTVNADATDVVDRDCETINRAGAAPTPPGTTAPGTTTPGKTAPGGANGGGAGTPTAALGRKVTLAKALKSGFAVKVRGVDAGTTVKLAATRKGKVVARGAGKAAKNGTATITLRFTKQAKRSLRHAKSITLKVTGGGVTATVALKRR
jgi:Ca2+-binding RTX toxin-like protein